MYRYFTLVLKSNHMDTWTPRRSKQKTRRSLAPCEEIERKALHLDVVPGSHFDPEALRTHGLRPLGPTGLGFRLQVRPYYIRALGLF